MAEETISVGYEREEKRHPWLKIVFVVSALVIGLATATQILAYKFDYHEALGFHYHHVYFPGMFLVWYWELGGEYPVEFQLAVSYGMAASAGMLLVYVIVSRILSQSARGNSKLHGTAHWASAKEVKNSGLIDIIASEYTTAAKISESIGLPVVATVGNDNLVDAAKEFRAANPDKPIIIAADRDAEIEARFAAAAISAAIVLPNVADKAMEKEVNSFNDLARVHGELGKDAVKGQLQPAIDKEIANKTEKTRERETKAEKQRGQELARA